MFYAEFGFRSYSARISNYIIRFVSHYDEYRNSILVRSVDIGREVVWC